MFILNSLVPIFAVIALGAVLRWSGFLNQQSTQGFNRFAYYFALPAFLVTKLAQAVGTGATDRMMLALVLATIVTLAVAWGVAQFVTQDPRCRGALVHASFRGNLAFLGLPLILFVVQDRGHTDQQNLEAAVLLAMTPIVILYNVAAVLTLVFFNRDAKQEQIWRDMTWRVCSNPILGGCIVGMLLQTTGYQLPVAMERSLTVIGTSAFPLALLGIGSQLASISIGRQWQGAIVASVIKCVFCPVVGWLIATCLGLEGIELLAIVLMCGTPTAVSSFVLTDQMNGDSDMAASSVVISTSISLATLTVILLLM
ncbi:MAG: AEC family transporter [Planctomycetota bacterium]